MKILFEKIKSLSAVYYIKALIHQVSQIKTELMQAALSLNSGEYTLSILMYSMAYIK